MDSSEAKSNFRTYTKYLVLGSGWIAAFLLGLLELPSKINSFFEEAPKASKNIDSWLNVNKKFSGSWSTAYSVIESESDKYPDLENGPLAISMQVYDDEMEGLIVSDGLQRNYLFNTLDIVGVVENGIVEGKVIDVVEGKFVALAEFTLISASDCCDNELVFNVTSQSGNFLPTKARLVRDENAMTDMPPQMGQPVTDFLKSKGANIPVDKKM